MCVLLSLSVGVKMSCISSVSSVVLCMYASIDDWVLIIFFFQAEDGIRDLVRSRGLGDVYKRQLFIVLF